MFYKISVLAPAPEPLFNKVTGPAALLKEKIPIQGFFDKFREIFKTLFLYFLYTHALAFCYQNLLRK